MTCAEHQGTAWDMVGVGDAALAEGCSGGASGPDKRGTEAGWWSRCLGSARPRQV